MIGTERHEDRKGNRKRFGVVIEMLQALRNMAVPTRHAPAAHHHRPPARPGHPAAALLPPLPDSYHPHIARFTVNLLVNYSIQFYKYLP